MKKVNHWVLAIASLLATSFGLATSAYAELTEEQLTTVDVACKALNEGDIVPEQLNALTDDEYRAMIRACQVLENDKLMNGQLTADEYTVLEGVVTQFESHLGMIDQLVASSQVESQAGLQAEPQAEPLIESGNALSDEPGAESQGESIAEEAETAEIAAETPVAETPESASIAEDTSSPETAWLAIAPEPNSAIEPASSSDEAEVVAEEAIEESGEVSVAEPEILE